MNEVELRDTSALVLTSALASISGWESNENEQKVKLEKFVSSWVCKEPKPLDEEKSSVKLEIIVCRESSSGLFCFLHFCLLLT